MVLRNVLDFLVPTLWLLLAVATLGYFWHVGRRRGWLSALRELFSARILWPLAGLMAITVVSASLVFIDPKEVGVVVSLLREGGIRERPLRAGLHLIVPLAEQVIRYPVIVQSYTMSGRPYEGAEVGDDAIRARTSDGQLVIIDVTMLFRLDPENINHLHIAWQDRYVNDLIRPALRAYVRSQASKFTVDEINSNKRKAFEDALNELTREQSRRNGIIPEMILVRNITFSPLYAQSVEEKMEALQRVSEAENKARQMANLAKGEGERIKIKSRAKAEAIVVEARAAAEAQVVRAEAEAKALELIAAALQQRDNLLTYRYIDKLSPNIRAMLLPSGAPLILPMPQLEQEPGAGNDGTLPASASPQASPAVPGPLPPSNAQPMPINDTPAAELVRSGGQ